MIRYSLSLNMYFVIYHDPYTGKSMMEPKGSKKEAEELLNAVTAMSGRLPYCD